MFGFLHLDQHDPRGGGGSMVIGRAEAALRTTCRCTWLSGGTSMTMSL